MTRRERLERKMELRQEWATKAQARSNRAYQTSQSLVENIPMGQPILVGHHSEKRHRRALDRSWNALGRSVAESKLADHHESKAAGISAQLDRTIFSDDDNAVEALEQRIAEREAERDLMKARNAAYRKRNDEKLVKLTGMTSEQWDAKLADAYSWCKQPHPAYELQNIGGRITADKKRLEGIKRDQKTREQAEAAPSGMTITEHGEYACVTFAEKPDRSILNDLKDAGFRWSNPSWYGQNSKLPESVKEMIEPTEPEPPAAEVKVDWPSGKTYCDSCKKSVRWDEERKFYVHSETRSDDCAPTINTFLNTAWTEHNPEVTNVVACQAETAPNEHYEPADDTLIDDILSRGGCQLWIEAGVKYFGWL